MLTLYSYFRSSAAYRVRIALNLKELDYAIAPVHLVRNGGEHLAEAYRSVNPSSTVPALRLETGEVLTQSMAIIEYLDETWPSPPLLPRTPGARARVRALAQMVACDIHPINNLGVLKMLREAYSAGEDQIGRWYRHWAETGLGKVERALADGPAGAFCHGDTPTLADCVLVPQVFNARRHNADLAACPKVLRIVAACESIEAFRKAAPENQPDAE